MPYSTLVSWNNHHSQGYNVLYNSLDTSFIYIHIIINILYTSKLICIGGKLHKHLGSGELHCHLVIVTNPTHDCRITFLLPYRLVTSSTELCSFQLLEWYACLFYVISILLVIFQRSGSFNAGIDFIQCGVDGWKLLVGLYNFQIEWILFRAEITVLIILLWAYHTVI